ncbi:MAG TPA: hypothetical protein PLJ42_02765 [Chitinophagales bacterium]|jgi:hypothetical protein|nr:hypothetical protein [Chitinophagales bacterium]MBP6154598.1 hypothetical protein [Chitinophagales bacterium]HQV77269.1 hypothetical protein [Chitinophagales bacterium]HQW78330.1 hypothetical protein [Chitinophagales bacterium]HRB67769.1 hypothetical protein [Chitinophagales bacterium]
MRILILFFTILLCNTSFAQNYDVKAYQFHQSIVEAQENIGKEMYEFNTSATELNLKILKYEINRSMVFLDSLKVYNNETNYYNATKKLFDTYKNISEQEHPNLLKIVEDPDMDYKDFKVKKIEIFNSVKKKMENAYPSFNEAQKQFCLKYKLKLE